MCVTEDGLPLHQLRVKDGRSGLHEALGLRPNVDDPHRRKKGSFQKLYENVVEEVGDLRENENATRMFTSRAYRLDDNPTRARADHRPALENAFRERFPGFRGDPRRQGGKKYPGYGVGPGEASGPRRLRGGNLHYRALKLFVTLVTPRRPTAAPDPAASRLGCTVPSSVTTPVGHVTANRGERPRHRRGRGFALMRLDRVVVGLTADCPGSRQARKLEARRRGVDSRGVFYDDSLADGGKRVPGRRRVPRQRSRRCPSDGASWW